ncbi:MAG TPA: hypothetical protein VN909_03975 [Candidatus Dormibacteraeota bacterium]|nr:hypothetical protein [Candidatus Dormibacteraeota bacterium]
MLTPSAAAAALTACGIFGANGAYTLPVVGASIDRESSRYVQTMVAAGNAGGFWMAADPVEFVNVADNATPAYRVRQKVPYHRFDVSYPWQPGFRIEPLGDAHAIVVQVGECRLYETYGTSYARGALSAYSGATWSLRRPFVPLPPGSPSAMASGLSLYAGMVRWEEVASGSIGHALNWAAPAGTVSQWSFVRPASDAEGIAFKTRGASYQLPYGAHLRLRASFDASRFGPQSAAIVRAMKTYGIYLSDTARANELYDAIAQDGSNNWNERDLAALDTIRIADFDVLSLGRIERVPGH